MWKARHFFKQFPLNLLLGLIILTSYSPPFFACHAQVWLTMFCLCQHACLPSVANSLGPLELVFLSFFYLVISQDTSRKRHSNWITGRVFNNLLSTVWSESRGTTRNDTGIVPRVSLPLLAYKGQREGNITRNQRKEEPFTKEATSPWQVCRKGTRKYI